MSLMDDALSILKAAKLTCTVLQLLLIPPMEIFV